MKQDVHYPDVTGTQAAWPYSWHWTLYNGRYNCWRGNVFSVAVI